MHTDPHMCTNKEFEWLPVQAEGEISRLNMANKLNLATREAGTEQMVWKSIDRQKEREQDRMRRDRRSEHIAKHMRPSTTIQSEVKEASLNLLA